MTYPLYTYNCHYSYDYRHVIDNSSLHVNNAVTNMPAITIPKDLSRHGELVVIPRKEYEALRSFKRVSEFAPTLTQKRALMQAEKDLAEHKTLSYNELVKKMGLAD